MKKLFCALLVLALLLCICGCEQETVNNTETTQAPTTEGPTETNPTETTGEEDTLPDYHFSKMEYVRPDGHYRRPSRF